jgi:hypothetical protein
MRRIIEELEAIFVGNIGDVGEEDDESKAEPKIAEECDNQENEVGLQLIIFLKD